MLSGNMLRQVCSVLHHGTAKTSQNGLLTSGAECCCHLNTACQHKLLHLNSFSHFDFEIEKDFELIRSSELILN